MSQVEGMFNEKTLKIFNEKTLNKPQKRTKRRQDRIQQRGTLREKFLLV